MAQAIEWSFFENAVAPFIKYVFSFAANCTLGLPPHLCATGQTIENFISRKTNGDWLVVSDCFTAAANNANTTSCFSEAIYLVVFDKLNLPYFQIQPESFIGNNAVGNHFKNEPVSTTLIFRSVRFFPKNTLLTAISSQFQTLSPRRFSIFTSKTKYIKPSATAKCSPC